LSRDQFFQNRRAIQQVRQNILEDFPHGSGLGCSLEMDHMSFVKLDVLESALSRGCDDNGILVVQDVDNRTIRMKLLYDQLHEGGMDLVKEALEQDRVRHHCFTQWKENPTRSLSGHSRGSFQGDREMVGVSSLNIELRSVTSTDGSTRSNIRKREDDDHRGNNNNGGGGGGGGSSGGETGMRQGNDFQKRERHTSNQSDSSTSKHLSLSLVGVFLSIAALLFHSRNMDHVSVEASVSLLVDFGLSSNYSQGLVNGLYVEALQQAYHNVGDEWTTGSCGVLFSEENDRELCKLAFETYAVEHPQKLDQLSKFLRHLRTSFPLSSVKSSNRVVIVGGGPAGLLAGVAASQAGCTKIDIIEKRNNYNREIYFDLSDNEFGTSMAVLSSLGIHTQNIGMVTETSGVVTMKCSELEYFLTKVAFFCFHAVCRRSRLIFQVNNLIFLKLINASYYPRF
jgi:hypothetical protein